MKIVPDKPEAGVYLYVFENGKCIRDELQNDVAVCKQIAKEDFGVLDSDWTTDEPQGAPVADGRPDDS